MILYIFGGDNDDVHAPPIPYFIVSAGDGNFIGWSGIGVVVGGGSVGVLDVPNFLIFLFLIFFYF